MKYKKLFLIMLLLVTIFIYDTQDVTAYDKQGCLDESGNPEIQSIIDACGNCISNPGERWGAIWFTDNPSDPHGYGVNAQGVTSKTIYLRGQYNQCGSSITTYDGMTAVDIRFYRPGSSDIATYLSSVNGAELDRGHVTQSGSYTWSSPGNYLSTTLYLNDEFYQDAEWVDSMGAYLLDVGVWRCPKNGKASGCGVSPSPVIVRADYHEGDPDPDPDPPNPDPDPPCTDEDCPTGSATTTVDIKQKNKTTSKFDNWTDELIYAKPGDTIIYNYSYYSGVQALANQIASTIDGGHEGDEDTANTYKTFVQAESDWDNYYITSDPSNTNRHDYANGEVVSKSTNQSYSITSNDVGKTLEGSVTSSFPETASNWTVDLDPDHVWTFAGEEVECPKDPKTGKPTKVAPCYKFDPPHTHTHTNPVYNHEAKGIASKSVGVRIPFNYEISDGQQPSKIKANNPKGDIVYAGETITVSEVQVGVNKVHNGTLNESYATKTQNAKIDLYAFWTDGNKTIQSGNVSVNPSTSVCSYYNNNRECVQIDSEERVLNKDSELSGVTEKFFNGKTYNVFDVKAGSKFCLAYSVSISRSSSNVGSNSSDGNHYISKPTCFVVAKKPIFQVWGGSIYSNGTISANIQAKTNLQGNLSYTDSIKGNGAGSVNYVFASWAEQAVVAKGNNSQMSSGAATSYVSECKRAPLTISNSSCNSSTGGGTGNSGITVDNSVAMGIRARFVDKAMETTPIKTSSVVDISGANIANNPKYFYFTNNATISASAPLIQNITHIVYAKNNIFINSDLTYVDGPYTSLTQIPQYIIIADRDINIGCHVKTIHAQLIAGGAIKTCTTNVNGDEPDSNSSARSNQLKIHGSLIAEQLILGRTYGAGTGSDSTEPAEIIDLDPTTYFWSGASASKTPTLHAVYTKELAPRY